MPLITLSENKSCCRRRIITTRLVTTPSCTYYHLIIYSSGITQRQNQYDNNLSNAISNK